MQTPNFGQGLLVLDGDWVAFKLSSVLETKHILVSDLEGKSIGKFKNRTEYKKSKKYDPTFEIQDCQVLKNKHEQTATFLLKSLVNQYLKRTGCNRVSMALSGPTNFRDRLNLIQKYKGNRDGLDKPLALYFVRDLIKELYPHTIADDEEADDEISRQQFKSYKEPSERIVVCTLDKDARGTPGLLYNPDKDTLVSIEGLGFLQRIEKISSSGKKSYKLYGEGRKWFYSQLLTGDKVDNYFPCDHYKTLKGISTKSPIITDLKCFNLLDPCTTDKECWTVITEQYKEWYGTIKEWTNWEGKVVKGTWLDLLQVYVDVVHMRRWDGDRVLVSDVLKKLKVL